MLRGEMAELKVELRGDTAQLRTDIDKRVAGSQRWAGGILAGNVVAPTVAPVT